MTHVVRDDILLEGGAILRAGTRVKIYSVIGDAAGIEWTDEHGNHVMAVRQDQLRREPLYLQSALALAYVETVPKHGEAWVRVEIFLPADEDFTIELDRDEAIALADAIVASATGMADGR